MYLVYIEIVYGGRTVDIGYALSRCFRFFATIIFFVLALACMVAVIVNLVTMPHVPTLPEIWQPRIGGGIKMLAGFIASGITAFTLYFKE